MSKGNYSKEELIKMCDRFLEDPSILYKQSFIISIDTIKNEMDGERTEFIAEYLNSKIAFLKNIQTVPREKYKMNSHDGKITNSNQREKNLAKELYNQSKTLQEPYDFIGIIEDYETPLKKSNDDIGVGKIDLLSVSKKESCVYILELKKEDSDESMLRCVLEAYTYLKQVNEAKLKESFGMPDYPIKAAPLVFKDGNQWREMHNGNKTQLKKLMVELGMLEVFYYFKNSDGKYEIIREQIETD